MTDPWSDLTEAQRQQIHEAHAAAKLAPRCSRCGEKPCACCPDCGWAPDEVCPDCGSCGCPENPPACEGLCPA